jgi:MHS family proline/betaine transporter-like MFS transporter
MSHAAAVGPEQLTEAQIASLRRRAILACSIGNFFELFDFTIYGFFAVAIARAFYPGASMYATFATFGVAYVMRPVGAIVIGAYGDRVGRRAALVVTIVLMALSTGCVGLIPSYASIGVAAPVLLLVCRLGQGFSTGGEWGGAAAFLVEYSKPNQRGLTGAWQQFSTQVGSISGSVSALLLSSLLSDADFYSWGWRVPFLCGFVLGPVGYYLRKKVGETPAFERAAANRTVVKAPLKVALSEYPVRMLQAFGVSIIGCVISATNIYLTAYAIRELHLPPSTAFTCAVSFGLVVLVTTPLVGALTDRIGRRPTMLASGLLNLAFDYPLFMLAIGGGSFWSLWATLVILGCFQGLYTGTIPSILAEMFPTRVRYTGLSVSYGFAVVLFNGFAPFIATLLVDLTGNPYSPAFYSMLGGALTAIAVLSMKEVRETSLE